MSMQEAIQAEKRRAQAALDQVADPGAVVGLCFPDGGSVDLEADGFVVLRALPQVDGDGRVKQWRYDLLLKEIGYEQGMQYVHLISKATMAQTHERSALLVDEHGNEYVANVIEPEIDPDRKAVFAKWRAHKATHADTFERIDAQLLDEYAAMAEAGEE